MAEISTTERVWLVMKSEPIVLAWSAIAVAKSAE